MGQRDSGETDDISSTRQEPSLRAQIAVRPSAGANCGVVDRGEDAAEFAHQLKRDPEAEGKQGEAFATRECHTELTFAKPEDQDREYLTSDVTSDCVCPVFEAHDCIPEIKSVHSGAIVFVVSVPDRDELRTLIEDLRDVAESISIEWLVDGGKADSTAEIDVSDITPKQREALETALDHGYYETPRETDLATIADDLGISDSAASQRLNAAETKLVKSFIEE